MNEAEHQPFLEAERQLGKVLEAKYAGQWVAVRDHQVVNSAATLAELVEEQTEAGDMEATILHVPEEQLPCFFYQDVCYAARD